MKRREFITLLGGGAVAWPLTARAQQAAMPVVGFLGTGSPQSDAFRVTAVRQGLMEAGYIEGKNVAFEYRWAEDQYGRLPVLASELVRREVAVIIAIGGITAAIAAKSATATIPIVFEMGGDPIEAGLVTSFNRPGGNVTGVTNLIGKLAAKQFEVLQQAVPNAALIGFLVNPTLADAGSQTKNALAAAESVGQKMVIVQAHTDFELGTAFDTLAQQRASALVVGADPFFNTRRNKLVELAARQKLPTMYSLREFVEAGGLMSYGTSIVEALRIAGLYTGRILKGEKPADLPVQQSTKVELIINLKSAKALGIIFPLSLLGRADEVIE
ncbi:ABC transporter substrate-binding protein [Bradyrhizobium sp.]|uniref:ABC transporter substrate-binding protein n=1 Tax=Bradyrhizobium sp. TaxID=376 RepID=UPI003C49EEF3